MLGGAREVPLKRTDEAGAVLVTYGVGDFFDAHPTARQEIRRPLHSSFGKQMPQGQARMSLEQVLDMRIAQIEPACQLLNRVGRFSFNDRKNRADMIMLH